MHRGLIAAMLLNPAAALLAPGHARRQPVRRTQSLAASVDVADLKVSMDDLDKPLEELTVDTRGIDHTSRTGIQDDGCAWTERADSVEANVRLPHQHVIAATHRETVQFARFSQASSIP